MNLHLIPNEKFTEPYIDFVNENFIKSEHLFLILGKGIGVKIKPRNNVIEIEKIYKNIKFIINQMYKSKKIIIHGLFSPHLVILLFFQPWLLRKCYWVVWGGDLYYYKKERTNIKSHMYEFFRKYVIKNMSGIITHIKGDYELAKRWYGTKGTYYYSFMYPSNLYKAYEISNIEKENNKIYIQIGNSADPSNNHIEVLKKLEKYKDENIEIICPLSYGNIGYRDNIIREGNRIFGKKFIPLIDFLPFDEYLELLAKTDIAIFNHRRQQAMGNISTLLGLGKKVYIRNDITTWQFCAEHGFNVYSSNGDFADIFDKMDENIMKANINNTKRQFSEAKLIEDLKKIFNN